MESRVFWFFVIYVSCILRKNAFGESTFANSSMSINNTSQPNENMLKTGNIYIRTAESIETKTKLNGITLKTECSEFEIPLETPKNLSQMMKILSDFLKAKCPRYCIKKEQMETDGKNNSVIDDINLFLFFATNESEGDDNINVTILHKRYCLLDNSPNMKITRHLSIYNRNLTVLDNCEKKKLVHGINLSEYTKIFIDVNVAKIIIKILENFTYAVSSTKINTENNFNKTSENTQRDSTTTTDDAQENIGNNQTNIYFAHTIPLVNSKINKRLTGREFVHVFERSAEIVDEKEDQEQKIQPRSSEIASLNEDIEMKLSTGNDILMQIQNNDQDFSAQFAQNIGDASFERKKIVLDVNVKSNLIAVPGTNHRVLFDLTNNCVFPVKYAIQARSSPFRIINVQPINLWLYPGQTNYVAVDIVVPLDTPDASVNTLTLAILGTEIPEKTVNIYVQKYATSKIKGDDVKPTIDYYYNSNCAGKLDKDRCEKTFWSADIVVQDFDSGLKRVISTPNGLYLRTKFISGTKDRVTFYYLSNCCSTTATITAVDIFDNQHVHSIDVTVWDNLSQGEIAAIVLGALLLLFLIIILIIAIIYCVRRRNSHDMPYTQRYGSRPPARSERTSF
ncbi:uncharacterized protein LOC114946743 isoform X2 [Nylanderia fulva]|uniref:uncharacterized protein LOC114946743 isoform X2 n=1 Tax=Nylanderia fulva TaxID=613905 RepID=UPI0010FB860F|nr:uncharacterized protein LOC114946743 isoform X2 [Nylanderia fulva]